MAPWWVMEVKPNVAKWIYFAGFVITAVASWLLRDYSAGSLSHIPQLGKCYVAGGSIQTSCAGKGAVLRVSFGNFLFFAAHMLLLVGVRYNDDKRRLLHTGFWPIKFCLWVFALGICFAMPNHTFSGYGQLARVLSGIWLVFQIIILVDFVYRINEWLLSKENLGWVLVIGAFITYCGSLALVGALYHFYAPSASCSVNIFLITFTLLLAIAYTIVSVSRWRVQNAGLLTSGAVFAYCAWILWSALNSEPQQGECVYRGGTGNVAAKVIAFLLAIASVLVSVVNTGAESKTFDVEGQNDPEHDLTYRPDFFHAVFAVASAYLCMLYLSWNLNLLPGEGDAQFQVDKGWISVWVKMASQWVCVLLYLWTLLAPRIVRNRSFSFTSAGPPATPTAAVVATPTK